MLKGCLSGLCAGAIYTWAMKVFDKNKYKPQLSVLFGAVVAPVVNTGLFCLCMLVFYKDIYSL